MRGVILNSFLLLVIGYFFEFGSPNTQMGSLHGTDVDFALCTPLFPALPGRKSASPKHKMCAVRERGAQNSFDLSKARHVLSTGGHKLVFGFLRSLHNTVVLRIMPWRCRTKSPAEPKTCKSDKR